MRRSRPARRVALPPDAAGHLTRVLRLGEGDECVLFNGQGGEYAGRIASVGKRVTLADVGVHDPVERESPLRILLLQALARGEKMDLIVQKATELGVAAIRPVHTLHSGVKLDADQAARKLDHWRGVAISACEQCQRNRVPEVLAPLPLDQAVSAAPTGLRLTSSLDSPTRLSADALRTAVSAAGVDHGTDRPRGRPCGCGGRACPATPLRGSAPGAPRACGPRPPRWPPS